MKINANSQLGIRILDSHREQINFMSVVQTELMESKLDVDPERIMKLTEEIKKSRSILDEQSGYEELCKRADKEEEKAMELQRQGLTTKNSEEARESVRKLEALREEFLAVINGYEEHVQRAFSMAAPESEYLDEDERGRKSFEIVKEFFFPQDTKWYLIQESALRDSKLVKIDSGYSARSVKDIAFGHYTYLLGKDQYIHFHVRAEKMSGYFYRYADHDDVCYFEFRFDLDTGACEKNTKKYDAEFTRMLQILTYVELAEIEVTIVEPGRTNNKTKKDGKVMNDHKYNVYVVDSTWNRVIIRDSDFAVSGHFRLQACGPEHKDRKLIWIDPFVKHGYRRAARARIVHEE